MIEKKIIRLFFFPTKFRFSQTKMIIINYQVIEILVRQTHITALTLIYQRTNFQKSTNLPHEVIA